LTLTLTAVAVLAAIGGAWVIQTNAYGRTVAMVLLAIFGVALLSPRLGEMLARPLVALGNRLQPAGTPGAGRSRLFVHLRLTYGPPVAAGRIQSPMNPPIELAMSLPPLAVRPAGDGDEEPLASSCGFFCSGGGMGKPAELPNIAVAILLSIP